MARRRRRAEPERTLTTAQAAKLFSADAETVGSWARDGCPSTPPARKGRGASRLFNADEVQAWLQSRGLRLPGQRAPHGSPLGGRPAEADKTEAAGGDLAERIREEKLAGEVAKRRLNELKLERARGEVIGRVDHEQRIAAAIEAVRTVMLAMPRKYAAQLANRSEGEARSRLGAIARELLDLFAGRAT